jgi:ribosomal protein S18 acetylase RimI-like enzyme
MDNNAAGTVSLACAGQEDAIRSLVRRAYALYVPRMGKEPGPMLDDYGARVAEGSAYVLECDNTLCGALVLLDYPDHLLLDNVAIDPAYQSRGLGRILIDFAEDEAQRRGYGEIRLYTHQTMTENASMYAALGYEETARGEQAGYDRVFMRKLL